MAETVARGFLGEHWSWSRVQSDLYNQAKIHVLVDIATRKTEGGATVYSGTYKGIRFQLVWKRDTYAVLEVGAPKHLHERVRVLAEAFATVFEYRPFCRYEETSGETVFEWDKIDPGARFAYLSDERTISNLERLG